MREGSYALEVVSTASRDWSFGQTDALPVSPGDIFSLSLQIKADGVATHAGCQIATQDSDGNVLDWALRRPTCRRSRSLSGNGPKMIALLSIC